MALLDIQQRIAAAVVKTNRAAGSVKLIAVSKVQPNARVADVLLCDELRSQLARNAAPFVGSHFSITTQIRRLEWVLQSAKIGE